MKEYHIELLENREGCRIYNDDANPIITQIECFFDIEENGKKAWSIYVSIRNETVEIQQQFRTSHPNVRRSILGSEILSYVMDIGGITEFFKVIQEVDPIPTSAISQMIQLIDIDLNVFLKRDLIKQLVENGDHENALKIAIEEDANGDFETLTILANWYEAKGDLDNYLNTLANFPKTHALFISANEKIFESLQSLPVPKEISNQLILLENKLRCTLNCGLAKDAANFYDILCGNDGFNPKIKEIRGDPDTLIQIARVQRQMNQENKEMRAHIAKIEADQSHGRKPGFF